jgi:CRP-like cAMP-binding protein
MFIIQTGMVDIMHSVEGEPFAIERLYRGSIINHHAFLLNDEIDTDARCIATTSIFSLEFE